LAWRRRMESGDMMNVFAANDLEAADLLALARYDDGAPAAVTPATGRRRPGPSRDAPGWQRGEACRA